MELKGLLGWTIAIVFGLLLLQKSCFESKGKNDLVLDTVLVDTFYTEGPERIKYQDRLIPSEIIYDTLTVMDTVDTVALMRDYYALKIYEDSIEYEDCKLYVKEEVTMNKLKSRYTSIVAIKESIRTTEVMVRKPKAIIGVGGSVLLNGPQTSVSVDVMVVPRYARVIPFGGYDLMNGSVRVGAAWRFNIGRKDAYEPSL